MTKGMLEYLIVHEDGGMHESLLSTATRPFDLNVVLFPARLPGDARVVRSAGETNKDGVKPGAAIDFFVQFEDGRGKAQTVQLWSFGVTDLRTRKPAADNAPWVFNGSGFDEENLFSAGDRRIHSGFLS